MSKHDSVNTKIWLETRNSEAGSNLLDAPAWQSHKIKIDKVTQDILYRRLKNGDVTWDLLLHAAFGLLLSHLGASMQFSYGTGTCSSANTKHLHLTSPLIKLEGTTPSSATIKTFVGKMRAQLQKKSQTAISDDRYLLLFKSSGKTKFDGDALTSDKYVLILIADSKSYDSFSLYYHPGYFDKKNDR